MRSLRDRLRVSFERKQRDVVRTTAVQSSASWTVRAMRSVYRRFFSPYLRQALRFLGSRSVGWHLAVPQSPFKALASRRGALEAPSSLPNVPRHLKTEPCITVERRP